MKAGDKVYVTIRKNGYWKDSLKGTVIAVSEEKIQVSTRNGKRWYSCHNVMEVLK